MPFGAVFTSSAGGDIGGGRLRTRFRGPILAGYASTGDPGAQTMGALSSAVAGSAAAPIYSFYVVPSAGLYAFNVTSSASDIRWAHAGADLISYSTTAVQMLVTSGNAVPLVWSAGFMASSANAGAVYIPQTTYAVSSSSGTSSGATPAAIGMGAALIFDSLRNKLSVFSTVANQWLSVTLTSS